MNSPSATTMDITLDMQQASISNILYWTMSYKISDILFSFSELGILDALSKETLSARQISSQLSLSENYLVPLLELLRQSQILNRVSKNPNTYMLPENSQSILNMVALEHQLQKWHHSHQSLTSVLTTGKGKDPLNYGLNGDVLATYQEAMAHSTRNIALHMMHFAAIKNRKCVIDLGGADGALVQHLSKYMKDAQFRVVDRGSTKEYFNQRFHQCDQFTFTEYDLSQPQNLGPIINGADIIIMSNILHLLSSDTILVLLSVLRDSLQKGSVIVAYDQFITESDELDAAKMMIVDWVNCGTLFTISESQFAEQLQSIGFNEAIYQRFPSLPGAMVKANIT